MKSRSNAYTNRISNAPGGTFSRELLASVVAQTINATQLPHQPIDEGHLRGANALSKALGLKMANWWAPTAENYFQRIKKDQILAAIKDASGLPVPDRLTSLKKSDLAKEAEAFVKGTRWLASSLARLNRWKCREKISQLKSQGAA